MADDNAQIFSLIVEQFEKKWFKSSEKSSPQKAKYDWPDGLVVLGPEAFLPTSGDRVSVFLQPCIQHLIIIVCLFHCLTSS